MTCSSPRKPQPPSGVVVWIFNHEPFRSRGEIEFVVSADESGSQSGSCTYGSKFQGSGKLDSVIPTERVAFGQCHRRLNKSS